MVKEKQPWGTKEENLIKGKGRQSNGSLCETCWFWFFCTQKSLREVNLTAFSMLVDQQKVIRADSCWWHHRLNTSSTAPSSTGWLQQQTWICEGTVWNVLRETASVVRKHWHGEFCSRFCGAFACSAAHTQTRSAAPGQCTAAQWCCFFVYPSLTNSPLVFP